MRHVEIQAERLRLVLEPREEILARLEAMDPADRAEVSPDWLARLQSSTSPDPWTHGFRMVERASGTVIGSCGFKGPADDEGAVEIAYGVDPAHQGRGYATEAVQALTAYAFSSGPVRLVRAHTRPGPNALTRVLTKCGFRYLVEVIDPEDGLVWRWEKEETVA